MTMAERNKKVPQGGTGRSAAGESSPTAPDLPGVGCPASSGGDTLSRRREWEKEVMRCVEAVQGIEELEIHVAGMDSECTESGLSVASEDCRNSLSVTTEDCLRVSTSPKRLRRKRRVVEKSQHLDSDDDVEVVQVERAAIPKIGGKGKRRPASRMETEGSASAGSSRSVSASRTAVRRSTADESLRADELGAKIEDSALQVLAAIKKSGNLKGTIVKDVKDAVSAIRSASDVLKERSTSAEVMALTRQVAMLRVELDEAQQLSNAAVQEGLKERRELVALRVKASSFASLAEQLELMKTEREEWQRQARESARQLEDLKKSSALDRVALQKALRRLEEAETAAQLPPVVITGATAEVPEGITPQTVPEHAEDRIIRRVGELMNIRFAEMEERISVKRTRVQKAAKSAPAAGSSGTVAGGTSQTGEPSGGRASQPSTSGANKEGWATVVRRGKRKGAGASQTGPTSARPTKAPSGGHKEEPQRKPSARKVKARPPRSSAVVLTMRPGAEERGVTYGSVLTEAKAKISLAQLGITDLRFRVGRTGARILEIPGANTGEAADALAARIEEVLPEDVVRVSRPVKSAELRIGDLDDSTLVADVVVAVMREGGCLESAVKTGEIRRNSQGTGSVWVRCPVAAAKKLAEAGRLRIGLVVFTGSGCTVQGLTLPSAPAPGETLEQFVEAQASIVPARLRSGVTPLLSG
ncbi:myosin-14-like [Achroia grisella]|uniref:myosin-14-like n=1 Tax=Achroia grisella TaxID=688607 RepID=UPI0027D273E0|nr:myosin-14-like [Achroia grisella]